jgi:hypothetical protein
VWCTLHLILCVQCPVVIFHTPMNQIIHEEANAWKCAWKTASVKMQRKSLMLAMKLNNVKTNEAGEHQFHVCKVSVEAGLTIWSTLKNKHKIKEWGKTTAVLRASKSDCTVSSSNYSSNFSTEIYLCWELLLTHKLIPQIGPTNISSQGEKHPLLMLPFLNT